MSAPSIIQTDDIKRCYISQQWQGDGGEPLEKHHIFNGSLRDWSDEQGLWIWVTPQIHRRLHGTRDGVQMLRLLKIIGQMKFEALHSHEEFMDKVRKSYDG